MDLQALRYAAMVSAMRFDEVADAYASYAAKHRTDEDIDARGELLDWFSANEGGEGATISSEVRIILVSADFGREITTTVLWLNRFEGMDIRCVRLVPYRLDERIVLDVQQIIPLPEAADFQVRLRRKQKQEERVHSDGRDFTRYQVIVDGQERPPQNKRRAVLDMVQQLIERDVPARDIGSVLGGRFRSVEGDIEQGDAVAAALRAANPGLKSRGWFVDDAIRQGGRTWVLSKGWGVNTESTLAELSQRFPRAQVTFGVFEG